MAKQKKAGRRPGPPALPEDSCPVVLHPALKGYLTYRFYKTAIRLKAEVNDALSAFGILGVQLGMLRVLNLGGQASQVELGRSLGIDKATMVKLLDGLERLRLVERVPDARDRRVKWVRITPAGQRMIAKAGAERENVEKKFLAPLTAAERAQLEAILEKLTG